MKTILFFDKMPLSILYAKMSSFTERINCVHVAYSQKDAKIISEYGIKPDYIYLDLFKKEYNNVILDDNVLASVDHDIIEYTDGRFNLNGAIQSDRGFTLLTYEECLKSVVAHYRVWRSIFTEHHVDVLLHEPCSLFFNFIGCVLCKQQGGLYTYQVASFSDKYEFAYLNANNDDFSYLELKEKFSYYLSNPSMIDIGRCTSFLNSFREQQNALLGDIFNRKVPFFKLVYNSMKQKLYAVLKADKSLRIYDNVSYWLSINNNPWNKVKNIIGYKLNGVKFLREIPSGEKYFFYPFHLEPEAVVLYLGDGIYKNQTKLIENIAASLPAGYFLYVKDHPHEYAYRDAIDYKRLMSVPNIRLLDQRLSAKAIMKNAKGVVTINGTAGFEALLLNKQVYCFGHNMYSFVSRVNYVKNIRDLRKEIFNHIDSNNEDDNELMAYVMAYLESSHSGYLDCYSGGPLIDNIDYEENARKLARDIESYTYTISL